MLIAALVFFALTGGWLALQAARRAAEPLPNGGVGSCTLWFVGSSSIHKWTGLREDMAPWDARNRGVDGAMMRQLVRRFENDGAAPAPPRAIVFYGGENDIAEGEVVWRVYASLERFLAVKRRLYGDLPVFLVSLKPSPTRWANRPAQMRYNVRLRDLAAREPDLRFVDIAPSLLVGGQPGPFFQPDGIHLAASGYRQWARTIGAAVNKGLPRDEVRHCRGAVARPGAQA